ncbi:TPA: hypothetical protein NBL89_001842, partial [Corynebacterium striatum]|nr:hypothetical protein [Corynebacterium striatum]
INGIFVLSRDPNIHCNQGDKHDDSANEVCSQRFLFNRAPPAAEDETHRGEGEHAKVGNADEDLFADTQRYVTDSNIK